MIYVGIEGGVGVYLGDANSRELECFAYVVIQVSACFPFSQPFAP